LITTDLKDTSPDQTLTVTPPGNWTVGQFPFRARRAQDDAAASQVLAAKTNDAAASPELVQLSGPASKLEASLIPP